MSRSDGDYRPHDAEHAVLYRVIDEHLDAFLETTRQLADGVPLPAFVEQEFYDFLTCGILAHGFARRRCTGVDARPWHRKKTKGKGVRYVKVDGEPKCLATIVPERNDKCMYIYPPP